MSVQVYGCNHIAIEVDDVEAAVKFYRDVFNLEKMNDGERNRGKNRDGGTVGKSYSPIAHNGRHPASSLREIKCDAKPSRSGANAKPFSV